RAVNMRRGQFSNVDWYTTNTKDPGLRIVLPGSTTQNNTYYVRIRANSADLNNVTGGETAGAYQLQLRLREADEVAGSTVRYSDIRYATNGIEVFGMPEHSPIVGEVGEAVTDNTGAPINNNVFANAQFIGDLLAADRGTLSVSGNLAATSAGVPAIITPDIDWYQFTMDYQSVQQIGNSPET